MPEAHSPTPNRFTSEGPHHTHGSEVPLVAYAGARPQMSRVALIDRASIADFSWPASDSARLAASLLGRYVREGTEGYIANTSHDVMLAVVGEHVIPLVINDGRSSQCYLTSPYINYVEYALEYLSSVRNRWLLSPLRIFLAALAAIIGPRHLDRAVYINHWLLATGPTLDLTSDQLSALIDTLVHRFRDHALVFKGVRSSQSEILARLPEVKLHRLFNRQVYLWSESDPGCRKGTRDFRQDRKLLKRGDVVFSPVANPDEILVTRVTELYRRLYLEKYSRLNGTYTANWFQWMLNAGALQFVTAEAEGAISYFATYYATQNELIASVVGHDPELSRRHGLYRLGMSYLMQLADAQNLSLNLSSGAGRFKLNRGCRTEQEYELLYLDHLPLRQKLSWGVIMAMYNTLAPRVFSTLQI
jgi:hypothetical protein